MKITNKVLIIFLTTVSFQCLSQTLHNVLVDSFARKSDLLVKSGDPRESMREHSDMLEKASMFKYTDPKAYILLLHNQGRLTELNNDLQTADSIYTETEKLVFQVYGKAHPETIHMKMSRYMNYFFRSDIKTALEKNEIVLNEIEKYLGRNTPEYCKCLGEQGSFNLKLGNLAKAKDILTEAENCCISQKLEETEIYDSVLGSMAYLENVKGNYASAIKMYEKVLLLRKELFGEESAEYFAIINNLAVITYNSGYFDKSEQMYKQVIDGYEKYYTLESVKAITAINNFAVLNVAKGDFARADSLYSLSIKIQKTFKTRNSSLLASTYRSYGVMQLNLGKNRVAEQMFKESNVELEKTTGTETLEYSINLLNLGLLYLKLGNNEAASIAIHQCLNIRKKLFENNSIHVVLAEVALAKLFQATNDLEKANEILANSINVSIALLGENNVKVGVNYFEYGQLLMKKKDYIQADFMLNKCISILQPLAEIDNKTVLSAVKDKIFIAETYFKNYSAADSLNHVYFNLVRKSLDKSRLFLNQNDLLIYKSNFEKQLDILLSTIHHRQSKNINYSGLSTLAYDQIAFQKSFLLSNEVSTKNAIYQGNDDIKSLYSDVMSAKRRLSKNGVLDQKFNLLKQEADSLESILVKMLQEIRSSNTTEDAILVKNTLEKDEVILDIVNFELQDSSLSAKSKDVYGAFTLTADKAGITYTYINDKKVLDAILDNSDSKSEKKFYKKIYGNLYRQSVGSLYEAIIEPLEKSLEQKSRVYYSTSGLLTNVNFSAITNNILNGNSIEWYHVLNTGNAERESTFCTPINKIVLFGGIDYNNVCTQENASEKQESNLAYLDNPKRSGFDKLHWMALPFTGEEIENISKNSIGISCQLYSGCFAGEDKIRDLVDQTIDILHISTHGFYYGKKDSTTVDYSGLVFSGANRLNKQDIFDLDDGILTPEEISELDLSKIKMVVLSSCNSGLGFYKKFEGLYGLQRSFKLSGINTVVYSLWEVPDKVTSLFMTSFYNGMINEKLNPVKALKNAQIMISKSYSNPYYWAAFDIIN
ncbi:MAG: CHAT domain-containing tetratricopeptide repeat protein [Saprospiraceae bacterium]